ncbi:UDP-glucose 4-epimerase GalE [Candidatus Gracilibacteria bacterium]|nr:UDP-glucose 4-epimerase GalE [Candidatus Gracilibacteria bacterium]
MKTLLLTGGTGYIGSHCAVAALEVGYDIVILDNLSNSDSDVIQKIEQIAGSSSLSNGRIEKSSGIKFYQGDIRNSADLEKVFSENKIDTVLHFAGLKAVGESCDKPFMYYENNVEGTLRLTESMEKHGVKNIVFSSSATVYDPSALSPLREDSPTGNTSNPYGTSKFIIENILRDLATHQGLKVANLRYFNPIGAHSSGLIGENPRDIPNNLLPYIMKVASGELSQLKVFGDDYETVDGTGVRDYIHVEDLAAGHIAALEWLENNKTQGIFETFNLGTGTGSSVMEMIEITEEVTGTALPYTVSNRRPGDIATAYCNPEKALKILAWKTTKTIQESITDSWNYIEKQKS